MLGIMSHRIDGAAFGQLSWVDCFTHTQLFSHIAITDSCKPSLSHSEEGSRLWVGLILSSLFIQAKPQCAQRSNHPLHAQIHVVEIFKILPSSISCEISHRSLRWLHCYPVRLRHSHRLDRLTSVIVSLSPEWVIQDTTEKLLGTNSPQIQLANTYVGGGEGLLFPERLYYGRLG